jgi:coenzyme F420 hydrogenase subunit beta
MSRSESIERVVAQHLCMGCGNCAATRPDLVTMVDTEDSGRRPDISPAASADTLRELGDICPGRLIPARAIRADSGDTYQNVAWGPIIEVWEGHATNPQIRHRGASGGVVTALSAYCVDELNFTGSIHVRAGQDNPMLNESFIATSGDEIASATASRYAPASPCERLADLRGSSGPHVFIGKPCDVAGASRLAKHDPGIGEKLGLSVSIFCAGTPSLAGTQALIQHLGITENDQVLRVRYRGKGWPGRMTVAYRQAASGKLLQASTSYADGWGNILQKHKQWRCQLCADHLGDYADLSVGDPWYRPISEDESGRSLVIVRTERGRRILKQAIDAGVVKLELRSVATVAASQPNLEQTKGAVFGRCLAARLSGASAPRYPGAKLYYVWWRALSPRAKLSSIAGTIKRVFSRRIFRPEHTTPMGDAQ